jgi:hypothetical protein
LRALLERRHYPRLAMCAVLTLGGVAGFLTSAGLLAAGWQSMGWRYGVAALVGYVAFLLGLRVWLAFHGARRPTLDQVADLPDAPTGPESAPDFHFGGGGFSGGGAGASLEAASVGEAAASVADAPAAAAEALGALEEGAAIVLPVLAIAFIVAGLAGVVMVLVGAPGLLAELLLDGVIAGAAYRRLRHVPTRHWLHGALRRTWKPMLALTVTIVLAGLAAQWLVPSADSIGDLLRR